MQRIKLLISSTCKLISICLSTFISAHPPHHTQFSSTWLLLHMFKVGHVQSNLLRIPFNSSTTCEIFSSFKPSFHVTLAGKSS